MIVWECLDQTDHEPFDGGDFCLVFSFYGLKEMA